MGLNNRHARRMVFDLETAPLPEATDYLVPGIPPKHYKDPDVIRTWIAADRAEQLAKCSLDLDLCRIVALGWWLEGDPEPTCVVNQEPDGLRAFWPLVETGLTLVGYHCLSFDLPILQRRSLYLHVPQATLQVERWRHPRIVDLCQVLSYGGMVKMRSLEFYVRRFGFDLPDPLTGGDIAAAVEAEDWAAIAHHCVTDIRRTARLASRLGFFSTTTPPEA